MYQNWYRWSSNPPSGAIHSGHATADTGVAPAALAAFVLALSRCDDFLVSFNAFAMNDFSWLQPNRFFGIRAPSLSFLPDSRTGS